MLTRLSIRNIVLIEALDLTFGRGLGVLTGETGAGKSILLDALGLVLGNRADSGLVRGGEDKASVSASFEFATLPRALAERLDGAWNIVFLNALGDMFVARDPLGIRPLCYAIDESKFFAAASESVALANLGFEDSEIKSLPPGCAVIIENGKLEIKQFAAKPQRAHCFFEWIYFANVASTLDDRSVYMTRKALGEELARLETVPIDDDTIVVPVPDTAQAAAASLADDSK